MTSIYDNEEQPSILTDEMRKHIEDILDKYSEVFKKLSKED